MVNMATTDLAAFLRELADRMDADTTTPTTNIKILELYVMDKCDAEIYTQFSKLVAMATADDQGRSSVESTDFIRFLTMGWYVYQHLNP